MKKIVLICLLGVFVVFPAFSQVSWNVKAGMNLSKETHSVLSVKPGFQVGVGMDYFFTENWGIQSSVMLVSKGYKLDREYYSLPNALYNITGIQATKNNMYLEIPLLVAYRIKLDDDFRLIFSAGGYAAYGVGGKVKIDRTLVDGYRHKEKVDIYPSGYSRWDAGLAGGVALEYKNRYTIGFMGEWGLVKIGEKVRNHTYGITLGYKF